MFPQIHSFFPFLLNSGSKNSRVSSLYISWLDLYFKAIPINPHLHFYLTAIGGGRVVRRRWVNFQCRGVLLTWSTVGQGPIVLAVGAGGGCLDIFSLIYHFSFPSPSLLETARYRLKYCLKGPLSPKTTNQPTNLIAVPKTP